MGYSGYRTRREQAAINLKTDITGFLGKTLDRMEVVKESLNQFMYTFGLRERPEVDWTMALPTPEEVSN